MPEVCLESIPCASRAQLVESQATITETAAETRIHARNFVSRLVVLRRALLRAGLTRRRKAGRTSGCPLYFLDLVASFGVMLRRLRICRTKIRIVPCRISIIGVRYASCNASTDGSQIRNIALMAHIGTQASPLYFTRYFVVGHSLSRVLFVLTDQLLTDSGKTTLTESILSVSNYLQVTGSVDTGSTTTDFLPAERERGITIQSASIPVKWKEYIFNLIDTPGHADFGMEVESASRVIDGAVVLMDGVEGVEAQTKGVWGQLDR